MTAQEVNVAAATAKVVSEVKSVRLKKSKE